MIVKNTRGKRGTNYHLGLIIALCFSCWSVVGFTKKYSSWKKMSDREQALTDIITDDYYHSWAEEKTKIQIPVGFFVKTVSSNFTTGFTASKLEFDGLKIILNKSPENIRDGLDDSQ